MIADRVATGLDFTGATLALMQSLIEKWSKHPFFVQLARQIAGLAQAKTPEDESFAIWAWIRSHVDYRRDPIGTQWVQDPYETAIDSRAGNCANMAVLAGTLLQALGHPARALAVHWTDRTDWTHAVAMDDLVGRVVDAVSPTFDWPPAGKIVKFLVDSDGKHVNTYEEEGRGLGFSIGGWHPFRINTYLPTLKKLDPLANTGIGKALWKPIEKVNQTVNKDFAKGKVWSQNHRKELQIAAAIAATVIGVGAATGVFFAGDAAAGAAGVGEAASGAASMATAGEAAEATAVTATEAAGSAWASFGAGTLTVAKDASLVLGLLKASGINGKNQEQQGAAMPVGYVPGYGGGGYSSGGGYSGGGGGGPLGFDGLPQDQTQDPVPWMLIGGGALVLLLLSR